MTMIIKKNLLKRTIGMDTVLIPIGKTILDSKGLFMLNELGAFIWDILPEVDSEEEICRRVLAEYDETEEIVKADIFEFLEKLRELSII